MRRLISNALSILTSDVVNRISTFALYALVARYLGVFEFGQLSIALTLFYTFQIFAVAGLKTLTLREVASDRGQTNRYIVNASAVALASSLVALAVTGGLVVMLGYERETAIIVMVLSLGLIPFALAAVVEAVFQAWEKMHFVAYANIPVNLLKIALAFVLLRQDFGLIQVVAILGAAQLAILIVDWWLLLRHITVPRLSVKTQDALSILRATRTFLGIDGIIAISGSLNVILLSKLASETEVGFYTAAIQVMVPITLLYQSTVLSVFPLMVRRFEPTFQGLRWISERLIEVLLIVALPTTIGLFMLAEPVLSLLYGSGDLLEAARALRITIWGVILVAFTHVLGQALLASRREKTTLRIVAVDAVVALVAGIILISQFGYIGAAITALIIRLVDVVQHYVPVRRLFNALPLGRLSWKPVVATAVMALALTLVSGQHVVVAILVGAVTYLAVLLPLVLWSYGGPRQLRAHYLLSDSAAEL